MLVGNSVKVQLATDVQFVGHKQRKWVRKNKNYFTLELIHEGGTHVELNLEQRIEDIQTVPILLSFRNPVENGLVLDM